MAVNFSDGFFENYTIGGYSDSFYDDEEDDDSFQKSSYSELEYHRNLHQANYKKHDSKSAYYKFLDAVVYRLKTGYFKDNLIPRTDFRNYPGIAYEGILQNFTRVKEIKPVDNNPYYVWWQENHQYFHLSYDITNDWIKGEGIDFLEGFIIDKIVPYAKKYYPYVAEEPITKEEVIIEIQKTKSKNAGGRPIGSKNKKVEKVTFLPVHKIPIKENKLVLDSLIFAIADLVWRFDGIIYSKVISHLDISDESKKFVSALIINNSKKLENKYWYVQKVKTTYILVKKIEKRQGYYLPNGTLMSSYEISKKTGIDSRTLRYRLDKMSVFDATKDWQNHKNTL